VTSPPPDADATVALVRPGRGRRRAAGPGRLERAGQLARRHPALLALVALGCALRVVVTLAYQPALEFSGDSMAYLHLAHLMELDPVQTRPGGYPVFLRAVSEVGGLWLVPVIQHVGGIAVGIALYALLLRRGAGRTAATLAAAPVLLDAYELNIEHFVLAEGMFDVLLVGALLALLWSPSPSLWACGLAGVLLAAAALFRTIGATLGVLVLVWLVVRRLGWRRFAVTAATLLIPLGAYATQYHATFGKFALTGGDSYWLYGRTAVIANCSRLSLPPAETALCSPHPPSERPDPSYYVWNHNSPRFTAALPGAPPTVGYSTPAREKYFGDFAHRVIRQQTADYTWMVAGDILHYFAPGRHTSHQDWFNASWVFPTSSTSPYYHNNDREIDFTPRSFTRRDSAGPIGFLRGYQRVVYTPGPVLALTVLLAGAGFVMATRRRGKIIGRQLRWDIALLTVAGLTLIVVPAATVTFDYRYLLPTLVLLPPAAALAVAALRREAPDLVRPRRPSRRAGRPGARSRGGLPPAAS